MKRYNPQILLLIGFLCLSYIVKYTNGDVFGAGRLVVDTMMKLVSKTTGGAISFVQEALKETNEWEHQQELAKERKGGNGAAPVNVNVTFTVDGKEVSIPGVQATTQAPATAPASAASGS
jgi:hypothetical protein